jgi:DNA-binding NarL/FixJ family response regulator
MNQVVSLRRAPAPEKSAPCSVDRSIADMLAKGWTTRRIADFLNMAMQSVHGRIFWLQSKRWMTFDRRLLTAWQRDRLIQWEKAFIEVEGV